MSLPQYFTQSYTSRLVYYTVQCAVTSVLLAVEHREIHISLALVFPQAEDNGGTSPLVKYLLVVLSDEHSKSYMYLEQRLTRLSIA